VCTHASHKIPGGLFCGMDYCQQLRHPYQKE
jgi:hypothetical protein